MQITAARTAVVACTLLAVCVIASAFAPGAAAEQASQPGWAPAAGLDAGLYQTCALGAGKVRCWGFSANGQLGYGNTATIGDDEPPGSVGPVDLGPGYTATAIVTGPYHTCALIDDGGVYCWGLAADGRLGYANQADVGTTPSTTPANVGRVLLGQSAKAITAGGAHTCAILEDDTVRCWGYAFYGELGYASQVAVGQSNTPASQGPVDLGTDRRAKAIAAGARHTCAILYDDTVRCWGRNNDGELGYGNQTTTPLEQQEDSDFVKKPTNKNIGDNEAPGSAGPVSLPPGKKPVAITAGDAHTCVLLDDKTVRCWGNGASGQLGYGSRNDIGITPDTTPDKVGPVALGGSAVAISAGGSHTCARLVDDTVRCWGNGANGRLGYASTDNLGDEQVPATVGTVNLGPGRKALAVTAGQEHTCARLDDASVRCWGNGGGGRLGYCSPNSIGDDEVPGVAGPVDLGAGGATCAVRALSGAPLTQGITAPAPAPLINAEAARARALRSCLATVTSHAKRENARARRVSARQRAKTRRHARIHAATGRASCLRRYGRTPGRVSGLRARALGKTHIALDFNAAGTDGSNTPPAHNYVVKQSLRPIRGAHDFARAQTLCKGSCRFRPGQVGGKVSLAVTDLRARTTYYYAVAARDNVSARRGPRSATVHVKTR